MLQLEINGTRGNPGSGAVNKVTPVSTCTGDRDFTPGPGIPYKLPLPLTCIYISAKRPGIVARTNSMEHLWQLMRIGYIKNKPGGCVHDPCQGERTVEASFESFAQLLVLDHCVDLKGTYSWLSLPLSFSTIIPRRITFFSVVAWAL